MFLIAYQRCFSVGASVKSPAKGSTRVVAGVIPRLFLLLLVATSPIFAQLHSLDVSQYLHTSWTGQDGYFRGAGDIAQTTDGYIWIISVTSLLRFDGARFVDWMPPNGELLPGKPPAYLLASKNGSLWIAGHGVAELRPDGKWHRYHELDSSSLVHLAEDKDGAIWVGVGGRAASDSCPLFRIYLGKVECHDNPQFSGLNFSSLYVDRKGTLWAGTDIGIWRILPGPPKFIQKTATPVLAFSEDSEGALLYAGDGPIWKLSAEGKAESYISVVDGTRISGREMLTDKEGGLWVGTGAEGVIHLHEGRVDHFSSSDGLSSDAIVSIIQDREGNVWVTSPNGVDKFTRPAVPRLTRKQGQSSDAIVSVLTDRHWNTWVGTDNGLNEIVADHVVQPSLKYRNRPALALVESHTGRLLISTFDRSAAIAPNYRRMVPDGSDKGWLEGYKTVFALAEDDRETLWATSRESGLLHIRKNGELIEAFNDYKPGNYPLSVVFDPKREGIWFTTHQGKLFFLKDGKISEQYGKTSGFENGPIRVLRVDKDGGVWIATRQELAHLTDGKVSMLGRKNGLPCNTVHWMQRDNEHNVWLYTECGLVSFSESDLSAWINQPSHVVTITHHLNNTEGVEETTGGGWFSPLTAMTKDGRILFAMRTGLGVLDPHQLNFNALPPPVNIEEINADGHEIDHHGQVSLPPNTGVIHIAYTALSFVAPRKVLFRYRLQGYDKDWSAPVSLRDVTYTNLPPKDYRFEVVACNNDGIWNAEGASVDFVVRPAWYQTLWFKLLTFLIFLGFLTTLYLARISRIEREMHVRFEERITERMRIARELHDTLLQSLQGLILSFSSFASKVSAAPEDRAEIERSLERADQLVISGRERIRDLRGETINVGDFATVLSAVVSETFGGLGPEFSVKIEGAPRPLRDEVRDETVWIVREALANVREHSDARGAQLLVSFEDTEFTVTVVDNGCGFDPIGPLAAGDGHYGLIGMRERAEAIGAHLSIHSSPARGTTIGLAVPERVAYMKDNNGFFNRLLGRLIRV